MNIISWGLRSDLLTKSVILETVLSNFLNQTASSRDWNQLGEITTLLEQVKKFKTTEFPTYILFEKHTIENTTAQSSQWQRIFDSVEIDELEDVIQICKVVTNKAEFKNSSFSKILALIGKIINDLAFEDENDQF